MKNIMKIKNAAKVNLVLDVTGRLPNGYHSIESIFQTIGLYAEIELTSGGISVYCSDPEQFAENDAIPCDERNIAFKAAKAFFEYTGCSAGCKIRIKKGIPSQAGLGGGSSDAAAVLYILNNLTGSEIPNEQLAKIGAGIGADVPFFLIGGTAYVSGIGEVIAPISDYSGHFLVIAKGSDGVSTAQAYKNIDSLLNPIHPQTSKAVDAINSGSNNSFMFFGNLFENAVKLSSIEKIKEIMNGCGALCSVMSGSGSAVFGLFNSECDTEKCAGILRNEQFFAQECTTVNSSFIEI